MASVWMAEPRRKIVYILGAGFSRPAHAPTQGEILPAVLDQEDNPELRNFLIHVFGHSKELPLEDVFTALDKSISQNDVLGKFEMKEIIRARECLNAGIIRLFNNRLHGRPDYVNQFADKIIDLRMKDKRAAKVSILSTNWDILLDNALGEKLESRHDCTENGKRIAFVDYCTYTRQLLEHLDYIPPSNMLRAAGLVNLKLLKLHGSFNWLMCPNCNSLFVMFGEKVADGPEGRICRVCTRNHSLDVQLRPILITPTFVKDFSNVHFKQIWWNAGFELSEATHIVFIGYSLPLSDFELRYLFARNIDKKSKIKVVLWSKTGRATGEAAIAQQRYRDFFGSRILGSDEAFDFEGVKHYVDSLPNDTDGLFW